MVSASESKAHRLCVCRLELEHFEREKRDREIRELREKELNERIKEEMMKSANSRIPNPMDPHWIDLRRFVLFQFYPRFNGGGVRKSLIVC